MDESQASEFDADIFAANILSFYIYNRLNSGESLQGLTRQQYLHAVLFSILLLFFFSNLEDQIPTIKSHPHPLLRISVIANYIEKVWIENKFVESPHHFGLLIGAVKGNLNEVIKSLFSNQTTGENNYFLKFKNVEIEQELNRFKKIITDYPNFNWNRPYNLNQAPIGGVNK